MNNLELLISKLDSKKDFAANFFAADLAVLRSMAAYNPFPGNEPYVARDLDGEPYKPFQEIAAALAARLNLDSESVCSALHFWHAQYFLDDCGNLDAEVIGHYLQTGQMGLCGIFNLVEQMQWAASLPEGVSVSSAIRAEILGRPLDGVPRHPKPLVIRPTNDATEPIFVVRNLSQYAYLRSILKLDQRAANGEISVWYANRAITIASEEECVAYKERLKNLGPEKDKDFHPFILCFPDDELVAALKRVGFVATCLENLPESLDQVRNTVHLAMPLIDGGLSDMPEEVLDGWLGDVCRTRMGDFPRGIAWPSLLAVASVLMPREMQARANLFVATVGPPGCGKSQGVRKAAWLLSVKEPWLLELKAGSAEGMAAQMEDVNGAPRLLFPDELGHLLEKAQIDNASFPYILNTAFYEDAQHLTVSRRKEVKFSARLSLVGGVVDDRFDAVFGNATTGGLYDRFLFGQCPANAVYLYRPPEGEPAFAPNQETQDDPIGVITPARPVSVHLDASAFAERDRWIKEEGISARLAEICLRCAIICASFDGRQTLYGSELGPALALAKSQTDLRRYLKPNPGERPEAQATHKIMNYLTRHAPDGRWVSRRNMYNAIRAQDIGLGVCDRALAAMAFNGYVEVGEEGPRGAKVIRLKGAQ